jgi:hypothetical protein
MALVFRVDVVLVSRTETDFRQFRFTDPEDLLVPDLKPDRCYRITVIAIDASSLATSESFRDQINESDFGIWRQYHHHYLLRFSPVFGEKNSVFMQSNVMILFAAETAVV